MTLRTSLPIAFVALMLSLALGGFVLFSTASAASSSARVQTTGTGRVVVHGQVVAFGLASGAGRIVVVDRRGDAQFTMNGRTRMQSLKGTRRKKRRVVIKNADGRFLASQIASDRLRVRSTRLLRSTFLRSAVQRLVGSMMRAPARLMTASHPPMRSCQAPGLLTSAVTISTRL